MRQAIITKFLGPTNTKGARIKASCAGGSLTIPYPHELNTDDAHMFAALQLSDKLEWSAHVSEWIAGSVHTHKSGYVYVAREFKK